MTKVTNTPFFIFISVHFDVSSHLPGKILKPFTFFNNNNNTGNTIYVDMLPVDVVVASFPLKLLLCAL
ncbi:hypothetical protein MtrunA17_Chr1g0164161 [Medicago truncatula]|uniref:Uncharacterized protein n=1 Tax=Medicago truncatula TaxID=3880 RepID=A0A396JQ42_MEDTR|nr:hypothetical protein MtrunA17_Chr1g0164161 [Medicago truncatula]